VSAHTPGPWAVDEKLDMPQVLKVMASRQLIADVNIYTFACGDNARLIAAAPDLLEVAYAAMEYDAAIKQAALEERNASTRRSWVGGKSLDALYANWITKAFTAIAKAEGK
jgi:hypothetical protein